MFIFFFIHCLSHRHRKDADRQFAIHIIKNLMQNFLFRDSFSPFFFMKNINNVFSFSYSAGANSNSMGGGLDQINTLNESEDSDCSATIQDGQVAKQEGYKSRQGPFTVVRQPTNPGRHQPAPAADDDENLKELVSKLERSCHLIRKDLSSAKGDLGNVNAGLCSIQKTADQVVEKLNKFNLKMFDLENQSTLLLKVYTIICMNCEFHF